MEKEISVALGIVFMSLSYGVYIYTIFKGETRPHPFSWLIWGLITAIVYFAQDYDGAGLAAIITGLSAVISISIAILGYIKRHDIIIAKSDWVIFLITLSAIPLWVITDTPLWSVIIITAIDGAGFYPTFRKTWFAPNQESALSYTLGGFKHLFTVLAISNYSIITVLFPAFLAFANFTFITMLYYRKWRLSHAA